MAIYSLAQVTLSQLQELAEIDDRGVLPELWEKRETGQLSEVEHNLLAFVRRPSTHC
jgi:hypothetical protein